MKRKRSLALLSLQPLFYLFANLCSRTLVMTISLLYFTFICTSLWVSFLYLSILLSIELTYDKIHPISFKPNWIELFPPYWHSYIIMNSNDMDVCLNLIAIHQFSSKMSKQNFSHFVIFFYRTYSFVFGDEQMLLIFLWCHCFPHNVC